MIKKCTFFCFLLPVFLHAGLFDWFGPSLSPKAKRAQELLEGIDPIIEQALQDFQVPGMAVGVLVDGHVIYTKGYGFRDVKEQLPVNEETLFAVGSCTKAFTTFIAGQLVDEGLITWDQPVFDILPRFRLWDQYATQNVTMRDLLTHRSGMPRHEFVWYNSKMTRDELLARVRYLQPSHDIRERYQYNNLMYFIAGCAMEEATGKSWKDLVTDRILKPLGMTTTNFCVRDTLKTCNYAQPYVEKRGELKQIPFRNLSLIGPAGCLNSNVADLTRWVQLQLDHGTYNNQSLISPITIQELHSPQVVVPGSPEAKETLLFSYGIGWSVFSYRGQYMVSHDGVSDGFTSVVGFLPNEKVGVVVLANKNMTSLSRYISCEIIDRILELPRIDWLKEGREGIRKNRETLQHNGMEEDLTRKKGTSPSHAIEEYVGEYEHPGYGNVTVECINGRLQMTYNDLTFMLGHWHYDVFAIEEEAQSMVVSLEGTKCFFSNNLNGEIAELSVPFEPMNGNIVFKKKAGEQLSTLSYLRQFTGIYEVYGYTLEVAIRNNALVAIFPGQPYYELVPFGINEFSVRTLTGSSVRFVMNPDSRVKEILMIHPYGTFTATPKV